MAQRCERPACAEPATVAYGFDPTRCTAWLEPFDTGRSGQGGLCRRHADAMVVPKGWWLDDRRADEHLFSPPSATEPRARQAFRSRHRPAGVVALEPSVPAPEPTETTEAMVEGGDGGNGGADGLVAWVPAFVAGDDLDGVLNATSPLLARAFGRVKGSGTRAQPPERGA